MQLTLPPAKMLMVLNSLYLNLKLSCFFLHHEVYYFFLFLSKDKLHDFLIIFYLFYGHHCNSYFIEIFSSPRRLISTLGGPKHVATSPAVKEYIWHEGLYGLQSYPTYFGFAQDIFYTVPSLLRCFLWR